MGRENERKELRPNNWISVTNGQATGRVIGGNLNTIQGIWGSPYMPCIQEGDILFIEDSSKDAATIERSFSFLKLTVYLTKFQALFLENMSNLMIVVQIANLTKYY